MNGKLESVAARKRRAEDETHEAPAQEAPSDFDAPSGVRSKLPASDASTPSTTYESLVETLLSTRENPHQPHPVARHVCAIAAAWAHADVEIASAVLAQLGLPDNRCQRIRVENHALSLQGSLMIARSACGRLAIVAYGSTDPFEPASWAALNDQQPALTPVPTAGADARVLSLHHRNQRASWSALLDVLSSDDKPKKKRAARASEPPAGEGGLEAIFFCGHGTGGACAALAAYRLVTAQSEQERRLAPLLAQVYTFGAPMFGNASFARGWNEHDALRERVFCHLHGRDLMPHLPPRGTQLFRHVGKHYAIESGSLSWPEEPTGAPRQAPSPFDVLRALAPLLREQTFIPVPLDRRSWLGAKSVSALLGLLFKEGPAYSFYDHTLINYVVSSQPEGVLSEFASTF